jgi:hypothetical protein
MVTFKHDDKFQDNSECCFQVCIVLTGCVAIDHVEQCSVLWRSFSLFWNISTELYFIVCEFLSWLNVHFH